MPTILKIKNIRFYFYSKEGKRAHIHAKTSNGIEVQIWLDDLSFKKAHKNEQINNLVMKLVKQEQQTLLDAWNNYFGE